MPLGQPHSDTKAAFSGAIENQSQTRTWRARVLDANTIDGTCLVRVSGGSVERARVPIGVSVAYNSEVFVERIPGSNMLVVSNSGVAGWRWAWSRTNWIASITWANYMMLKLPSSLKLTVVVTWKETWESIQASQSTEWTSPRWRLGLPEITLSCSKTALERATMRPRRAWWRPWRLLCHAAPCGFLPGKSQ